MLTGKQQTEARRFYSSHKTHVNKLIRTAKEGYPPTLTEDKNSPALWKATHWLWFFQTY